MTTDPPPATLVFRPAALKPWLAAAWVVLVSATTAAYLAGQGTLGPWPVRWFNLEADRSLPRVYAEVLLLAVAGLALAAAARRLAQRRPAARLLVLAGLGFALALEQTAAFRIPLEAFVLAPALGASARLASVVPSVALIVAGVVIGRPALPPSLRAPVVWAAAAFVAGLIVYGLSGFARAAADLGWLASLLLLGHALETAALTYLLTRLLHAAARSPSGYGLALGAGERALRPATFFRGHLVLVAILTTLATLANLSSAARGGWLPTSLAQRFNLDSETSLATAMSGAALLLAALLLAGIAGLQRSARDPWWPLWSLLAAIFAYLAVDELAVIHEHVSTLMPEVSGFIATRNYLWVLPAMPLVAVFALLYLRFLLHLPRRSQVLVALAGLLYVSGALGVELVGGMTALRWTNRSLPYLAAQTVEETLELAGIALLIYGLLDYSAARWGRVRVVLDAGPRVTRAEPVLAPPERGLVE